MLLSSRFKRLQRFFLSCGVAAMLCMGFLTIPLGSFHAIAAGDSILVEDHFATNSGLWTYSGDASRQTNGTYTNMVQLTPAINSKTGTIWLNQTIAPPFTITFNFQIADTNTPADGFVFMFNKQNNANPISGGGLGFSPGNGYGIEFDTWVNDWDPAGKHISLFKDNLQSKSSSNLLAQQLAPTIANGSLHSVRVEVTLNGVKMYMDDMDSPKLNYVGPIDNTYNGIGFAAATGGESSRHLIDDVVITRPASSNANLSALSIENQMLSFQPGTTNYTLSVPFETNVARFHFTPADSNAVVSAVTSSVANAVYGVTATTANALLDLGPNTINITVKAQNNTTQTYSVSITRIGSANALLSELSALNGQVLSPDFQSGTFVYNMYVPAAQPTAFVKIGLSDPAAIYSVTNVTYGSPTVTGSTYSAPVILTFPTLPSAYDLRVTAQDKITFRNYRINIVPVGVTDRIGYARMLDSETIELAFTTPVVLPFNPSLSAFHLTGTTAAVSSTDLYPAPEWNGTRIRLKLNHPLAQVDEVQLSLLPGSILLPPNQLFTALNIPILTINEQSALKAEMDVLHDGLHIDDVIRYMNSSSPNKKDLNGNGQPDRFDVSILLGLISE